MTVEDVVSVTVRFSGGAPFTAERLLLIGCLGR